MPNSETIPQIVKDVFSQRLGKKHLSGIAEDIAEMSISKIKNTEGVRRLDYNHVETLVKELDKHGYFELRGAVSQLSKSLDVCRVTIYKHINN